MSVVFEGAAVISLFPEVPRSHPRLEVGCPVVFLSPSRQNPSTSIKYARAGIAQSVLQLATGWTVRRSNPGEGEISAPVQTVLRALYRRGQQPTQLMWRYRDIR